jgi:hypothetical protein
MSSLKHFFLSLSLYSKFCAAEENTAGDGNENHAVFGEHAAFPPIDRGQARTNEPCAIKGNGIRGMDFALW